MTTGTANRPAELRAERIAGALGLKTAAAPAEETFWAFRKLFEMLDQERPLVLVIDDVHWAEPTLLEREGATLRLRSLARRSGSPRKQRHCS